MRARRRADGNIVVTGEFHEEIFADIHAGTGWPGEHPGAVVAVGRRLDGHYHILEEMRGSMFDMASAAVDLSSRLITDTVWVDSRDRIAAGLFRNRFWSEQLHSAVKESTVIGAVPEGLLKYFRSALEQARWLILTGSALINERLCPTLMYALRQDFDFALASPVVTAMVFGLMPLVDEAAPRSNVAVARKRWYGNRCRG